MDKMSIYNQLPIWGQNMVCFIEGSKIRRKRYSDTFYSYLKEYQSHSNWDYERMCCYRDKKLNQIIAHAYNNVPYYKSLFDEYGVNPEKIKTIDDLSVLPVLTKDVVKNNRDQFVSKDICPDDFKIHPTDGTTGSGLKFVTTDTEEAEQWAIWWRYRKWHGIELDTWCGNFGGKTITPLAQKRPPYWRLNEPGKQIFYSGYHINKDTAEKYAEHMRKCQLKWLHGYPSNLSNLAAELSAHNIKVPMKWVSIGAENLYESQIMQIEEAFCVKPIQHYGLTEGVANISERADGLLTVDEDFCSIEFTPSGNENEYHVIGTSLTNYAMPLIRYDTGDLVIIEKEGQHSEYGRTVNKINGRSNEYVLLPSGAKVGAASISLIINKFEWISAMQIVQKSIKTLDVNIMKGKSEIGNIEELSQELRLRFGVDIETNIHIVDELLKTKNEKQEIVVSEL